MSTEGLKFEVKGIKYLEFLLLQEYLKIILKLGKNDLEMKAKIVQHKSNLEKDTFQLGVQFYQTTPTSVIILKELIQEKTD